MGTTTRGYVYPDSTSSTRVWEHFQTLADDVDADVEALDTAMSARAIGVVKVTTETVTSSTTLQDDDELVITLPVGNWLVVVVLMVSGAAAGDIKVAYTYTATSVGVAGRIVSGPQIATADSTAVLARLTNNGVTTAIPYGTDGTNVSAIREEMFWQVTGTGNVQVQWAQNASSATATSVLAGSRMYAIRLDAS